MSYLLDTNVISEIRRGRQCDRHVAEWFASISADEAFLSVLVIGEIRKGVERIRPNDADRARVFEDRLVMIARDFADRILPIDFAVAEEWGRMAARRPLSPIDALLAATAKVHGLTLVTRNIADVAGLGADVLDPFNPR